MIYTAAQIDQKVSQISGTWVKRKNLKKKLTAASNKVTDGRIEAIRYEVRRSKDLGVRQQELAPFFSDITNLEIRYLED